MNAVGRQRSGAAAAHHQRQYSDQFADASSNGRWLQSAGLQHLQSSSNAVPPVQDFGYYNGGGQGSRMYRSVQVQRTFSGGGDLFSEPLTPPGHSRRKNGEEPNESSPGLLDLHSFDTELLPEMSVPGLYDGPSMNHFSRGRSFDDSDPYFGINKQQTGKARLLPDSNVLKSIAADNVKASNVAKIKVVVRKRPLNKKELAKNDEDIIETSLNSLVVHETKLKVDLTEYMEKHEFVFDAVLNEEVSNDEVYRETVEPIVPIIFQRTKATCFAYGQTGSGKTFTMKPLPLKAVRDILRLIHHTYRNQGFQLFVSFFEIYGGKLYDLLSDRKKLCMREDGKQQVCIVGLQEYRVVDVETVKELIERGNATRSTGTTGANEESSRSHAILQLSVKRSADGSESKPARVVGKLSFIDLAGSERGADTTDNDKQTRMEGAEINKSLLALKECIRALDNDQGHIPFRGSKLTEVLRDSFVGNSRTVMISCISPNSGSCEHTLNTLRYADRVKSLSRGNTKKDVLSSTSNLKESIAQPLSSILPPATTFEDDTGDSWPEQTDREDYDDDFYEQEKPYWKKNSRVESHSLPKPDEKTKRNTSQPNWKEPSKSEIKYSNSDDDLSALLKEEEDLVHAHRKQVEETMEIVREEMNLLVEADQPGNRLDDYISRLNSILSQKAAGILQLQNRLAHFQKRLKEHNVLVSSGY
ncbi:ATP binding microtubule motor family protein [Perilla frutescens var. hirtella]|uniref:Kinesin-like protein n=1 Tax=Perilla frutescens var. hirtella TaxID=608512 RepID=A0AAD4JHY1_PERFH|nr:ATP binding microtubule motor family protein [Perilla frutescens var. frutescens]KAH6801557.1 ATP binding microtubule motor family protein [Perilla frutescens var. hirtella]KAH6833629.1 ATP binding microtubule motor family protein [Perilla frutescens var. hirtella]